MPKRKLTKPCKRSPCVFRQYSTGKKDTHEAVEETPDTTEGEIQEARQEPTQEARQEASQEARQEARQEPRQEDTEEEKDEDVRPDIASQTSIPKRRGPSKRTPNIEAYPFSENQDQDLCQWFQENEIFYNRRNKHYKNSAMKTRIIEEKGKQFEPTASVDQIRNWMKDQRTMYGKLSNPRKKKSGSAAKPPTDREKWVLTSFTFLDAHITRIPSRASGKFGASSSSSEKDDDEDENEEDDEDDENVPSGDDVVDVGDDNEEADESRDPTQGSQGQAETVVPQNAALPDLEEIFSETPVAGTSGAASSTSSTSKAQRGRQEKSGKRKKGQKTKKSVEDKESLCQSVKSAMESQAKKIPEERPPPSAEEAELASFASDVVASMYHLNAGRM